ncbi:MAG TPA: PQQ-binding-like beta-propeller repeat protein [Pirellulales bacterium]|nr:PQQ-binding-like beta-propeller repeat protein [Pirellulales bacterium]
MVSVRFARSVGLSLDSASSHPPLLAVLPLLPAAAGLLAALLASLLTALTAAATLRPAALAKLGRIVWRQKPGLLVLGLAVAGLVEARAWLHVPGTPPAVQADLRSAHWPTFRGDLTRRGHGDGRPGPVRGGVTFSGGRDFQFYSSAAVADDALIAIGVRGDSSRFFSWQAESGRLLWTLAPDAYRATFSSPVLANGYLVAGEGLHNTSGARLVAFRTGDDGVLRPAFEFATRSHIECTPTIEGDRVYFAAGDDGVYCLSLTADDAHRVVWHAPGERYRDAETGLAVCDECVYVGLGRGGEALAVLDATSGAELARLPMPLPVFSPPAISGGRIYLGMGDADYVNPAEHSPGELRCLDLATWETVWTLATPSPLLGAVVADDSGIVFATTAGQLYVVDHGGQVLHRWQADSGVLAAPAVTPRTIYCVSCDGLLTALDRRLEPIFSTRLGAAGAYFSSPVVFGGQVFVGTPHDGFVCVGVPAAERHAGAPPQSRTAGDEPDE